MQLHNRVVDHSVTVPCQQNKSGQTGDLSGAIASSGQPDIGYLIINADDWGRDVHTTDRTLECFRKAGLSSASGMVFMQDSERAASIASEQDLDIGLHLNLSTPFSVPGIPTRLANHQQRVRKYLCAHRFARVLYHPGLANSFEYAVAAQIEEFTRLYGHRPDRIDGHHHMHLAANVLFDKLIPAGTIVRRNFSFWPGEKNWVNRTYRHWIDSRLMRRYCVTDFLFSLPALWAAGQLQRIPELGWHAVIELETHPVNPDEFSFLTGVEMLEQLGNVRIAKKFVRSRADREC